MTISTEELLRVQRWRYATKQFDPSKKLTESQIKILLESLRLSASSFGLQPWKFVVVENTKIRQELVQHSWGQRQVSEASHLIVLCSLLDMTETHVDANIERMAAMRGVPMDSLAGFKKMVMGFLSKFDTALKQKWMRDQVYLALGSLLTVCAVEGIDSCPMEGFDPAAYDRILGLNEKGLKSVVVCPVGYRSTEDKYSLQPKVRFEFDTVIEVIK